MVVETYRLQIRRGLLLWWVFSDAYSGFAIVNFSARPMFSRVEEIR